GICTLQERTVFEFITADDMTVNHDEMGLIIDKLALEDQERPVNIEVDERVFRQAYIPKTLFEVVDPERDVGIVQQGGKDSLIYAKLLDVQETKSQIREEQDTNQGNETGDNDSENESEENSEDDSKPRGKRHEDKDAKK